MQLLRKILNPLIRLNKLKKLFISAISLFVLFGCAGIDRTKVTQLQPYKSNDGQQYFNYLAYAGSTYPTNTKEAEDQRMAWLETWLSENNLCKSGFSITERNEVKANTWLYDRTNIYYTGKCK